MPFTAVAHREGKENLVEISKDQNPRVKFAGIKFTCVECGSPLFIRHPLSARPHFVHYGSHAGSEKCTLSLETLEHKTAKLDIRDYLEKMERYKGCTITLEYVVEGVRRADVMVTFPDGEREAHEIQLSQIPLPELIQRTRDYESRGIAVFWWLGEDMRQADVMRWLYDNQGSFGSIDTKAVRQNLS